MTIKELAEVCNVSTQSIRNYCKRNNLTKQHNKQGKPTYVIDEETEKAIISYFNSDSNKEVCKDANQTEQSNQETNQSNKALFEVMQSQIDDLRKQIQTLTEQLAVKDSQIQVLSDALAREQQALSQQQTLHALTMQDDSEADAGEPTATEQAEEPTEKKRGFFSRFKKSK